MKKSKKIYAIIMLLFFVLGLAVSFGYSYFKMAEKKEYLLLEAEKDCKSILGENIQKDYSLLSSGSKIYSYYLNSDLFETISFLQEENIFVYTDYIDSYNFCAVIYNDYIDYKNYVGFGGKYYEVFVGDIKEKNVVSGYIDYNSFLRSMTTEQYNSIKNYLNSKPERGECYSVVCKEFYVKNYEIFPKKIEVVIPDNYKNYELSNVIETFELLPDFSDEKRLHKNNKSFNEIPKDFILGKYDCTDLMNKTDQEDIYEVVRVYSEEVIYEQQTETQNIAPFTYVKELYDDAFYYGSEYDDYIRIVCMAGFNVLDYCLTDIVTVSVYTIALFLFMGIVLCVIVYLNMKKQLEQEQNLLTITNSLVHNLKTPLFVISGNAENLSKLSTEPKEKEFGSAIVKQVGVMDERINKMFELLRMETTDYKLKFEEFNITEVVEEIIDGYKNCEKQIEFYYDENQIVYADKRMMYSVIETLIDNAVLYGADDIVKVNFENYVLSVSNLSENIKKKDLKKFVKPYYRHPENGQKSGNGIGLAIAKNILKLHKTKFNFNFNIHNDVITVSFKINNTQSK